MREPAVKILFVTWYFPPSNTIAAVRVGKLAKFLTGFGHDVRVITVRDPPYAATLPVEIAENRIHRTAWTDINAYHARAKTAARRLIARTPYGAGVDVVSAPPSRERPKGTAYHGSRLSKLYQLLFNFPDRRIGWLPAARREALRLLTTWRPDAIFATAPPFTSLFIGHLLSRAAGVPLIVEFRDRWSDDPYYPPPWWRRRMERWAEAKIVAQAAALTTVSEPWAETYRARYGKPVAVIYNGYDPADLLAAATTAGAGGWPDRHILRITHTGGIYRGRRDPSPLFDAIRRHPDLRGRVRITFYGLATDYVPALARDFGVEDSIEVHGRVEHAESIRQQRLSDVLLLMQMDSPLEQGNVPGKFFEYLGSKRPILVLGWDQGVPATIVKRRNAGAATTDPEAIARQLRAWLEAKERDGCLPDLCEEVCAGFTHEEQAARLDVFLTSVLAGRGLSASALSPLQIE